MKRERNKLYVISIYVALALATIIAYEPVQHNNFVNYDDDLYVTENPSVNEGLTRESILWAFGIVPEVGNWHPLTWISHMLDCELFGLNPFWHHLTSLLFHMANTLILFWIFKRMSGAIWPSAFVAAAFALHPLHVESVAWVAERKDVLSGFFWMLTMAAYIRYVEKPGIVRYLLVFLALCLGLMAKPMLVTLPFVLLLMDYWPLGRFQWGQQSKREALPKSKPVKISYQRESLWHLIREKIPLFTLVVISSVVTYISQQKGGAVLQIEDVPLNFRIANAVVSYINYIVKTIYPSGLASFYPHPGYSLLMWQPIVSFFILAGLSAGIIYMARRRRYLVVGWLWYIGSLIPVIGLVQVGLQAMADRYTYLPSIGIFIMVAWAAAEFTANWRHRSVALGITALVVLAILLVCTRKQVRYWQDNITLFGRALVVTENNFIMHNNYGFELLEEGRLDEAVMHFDKALQIHPGHLKARNNKSKALLLMGKYDEAIEHFNKIIELEPNSPLAYYNKGSILDSSGKLDEAVVNYNKALDLDPNLTEARYNLGLVLCKQGRFDEAITHFEQVLQLEPKLANACGILGDLFVQQGRFDEAVSEYRKFLQITPDDPNILNALGVALGKQGKLDEAIKCFNKALQIKPDFAEARRNLRHAQTLRDRPDKVK